MNLNGREFATPPLCGQGDYSPWTEALKADGYMQWWHRRWHVLDEGRIHVTRPAADVAESLLSLSDPDSQRLFGGAADDDGLSVGHDSQRGCIAILPRRLSEQEVSGALRDGRMPGGCVFIWLEESPGGTELTIRAQSRRIHPPNLGFPWWLRHEALRELVPLLEGRAAIIQTVE